MRRGAPQICRAIRSELVAAHFAGLSSNDRIVLAAFAELTQRLGPSAAKSRLQRRAGENCSLKIRSRGMPALKQMASVASINADGPQTHVSGFVSASARSPASASAGVPTKPSHP